MNIYFKRGSQIFIPKNYVMTLCVSGLMSKVWIQQLGFNSLVSKIFISLKNKENPKKCLHNI